MSLPILLFCHLPLHAPRCRQKSRLFARPKEFKQQAAKEAEARRAKQEERAQRSRAKKDTFDDGIFTDEY